MLSSKESKSGHVKILWCDFLWNTMGWPTALLYQSKMRLIPRWGKGGVSGTRREPKSDTRVHQVVEASATESGAQ